MRIFHPLSYLPKQNNFQVNETLVSKRYGHPVKNLSKQNLTDDGGLEVNEEGPGDVLAGPGAQFNWRKIVTKMKKIIMKVHVSRIYASNTDISGFLISFCDLYLRRR